jgi:Thymidylate synthase complementing protein
MISAQVLCDSTGPHSPRLTTFFATFHKFILAERNTHRALSRSDRSSRAVPTKILIEEVLADPAMPVEFHHRKSGMGGGELLTGEALERCQIGWRESARRAAQYVQDSLLKNDESKETLNRHLDSYVYTHSVMTATELGWLNFFGLRLNKAAQPEIRVLAEIMWEKWNESKPRKLQEGDWHMPYANPAWSEAPGNIKVSTARCARTSYLSFETQKPSTIEEDLFLAERLMLDRHLGPFEHQATPDEKMTMDGLIQDQWANPSLHGNLPGWIQYRKTIPGEAITPLPEGYTYNA